MLEIEALKRLLHTTPQLELAILVGSRAADFKITNSTTPNSEKPTITAPTTTIKRVANDHSDWDIAIRWQKGLNDLTVLEQTEVLRLKIAQTINSHADKIDLIDINTARLAMRAVIAEEGILLKGEDSLEWNHFLTQTWAELEDYYWRKQHAA